MSIERKEIRVVQGMDDPIMLTIRLVDEDGIRTPYDLSTFSEITFTFKPHKDSTFPVDAVATYTLGNGELTYATNGTDGKVTVFCEAADLADDGKYQYVLYGTDAESRSIPLMFGPFIIQDA